MKFKKFRNGRCAIAGCYVRPKEGYYTCANKHRKHESEARNHAIRVNHDLHKGVAHFVECPLCGPIQLTLFEVPKVQPLPPCDCTGAFSSKEELS